MLFGEKGAEQSHRMRPLEVSREVFEDRQGTVARGTVALVRSLDAHRIHYGRR